MDRPGKYHISDPVLDWVYYAPEMERYLSHLEARVDKLEQGLVDIVMEAYGHHFSSAVLTRIWNKARKLLEE